VTTISNRQGGTITIEGSLANVSFADGSTATIAQLLAPSYTKGSTSYSQVSATAGNGITTLALTGNADVTGTANGSNMTIVANVGNDTLVAGTGSDTLVGGGISDEYVIAAGNQTTTITNSSMFDAISFGTGVVASDLSASESTVGGAEVITLTNSLGGTVNINVGQGAPVDTLAFADGTFASLGAILAQNTTGASASTSAVSLTLPDPIQNMQLTGSTGITVTANDLDDVISANLGNDTLVAGSGNDTLIGSTVSASSTTYDFSATDGDLVIQNSGANDVLVLDASLAESDITTTSAVVNGQTVVTLTTDQGQTITIAGGLNKVSFADGNTATIAQLLAGSYNNSSNATTYANVSTTAGTGITSLVLTGNANIIGTANSGNDTLVANSGNDTLVAGAGNDTFIGGLGNTTYSLATGYGAPTIENAGTGDVIAFGAGVSASNVTFLEYLAADGSTMLLINNAQAPGKILTIEDYVPGQADTVTFANGQSESIQAILAQNTTGVGAATSAGNVTLAP
jgi:Ca2+-binding RTX toxin-like protein